MAKLKRVYLQLFPIIFFQKIISWTHLLPALFFLARRRQFTWFFFSFVARSRYSSSPPSARYCWSPRRPRRVGHRRLHPAGIGWWATAMPRSNRWELQWWRAGEGLGAREKDKRMGGVSPSRKNTNVKSRGLLHICTVWPSICQVAIFAKGNCQTIGE